MPNTQQELKNVERQKILLDYQGPDRVVPVSEILEELSAKTDKKIYTKIPLLDNLSDGFRIGNLIVISAPTGQGKTTFCKTLTKNFTENGMKSIWFSYEVPPKEFMESFPKGNQYLTMPRELTTGALSWIENRILESKAKFNTNIVFIDHLHFLLEMKDLAIAKNQSILIGMILRELKKIALNHNLIIFLVAHMRKKDTENQIPTIDDLRDSSFVAQESDMVMLLWRKQRGKPEKGLPPEWTNESVLSVVKNRRTGKLGFVKLEYNFLKKEFVELDPFRGTEKINNEINPEQIFQ